MTGGGTYEIYHRTYRGGGWKKISQPTDCPDQMSRHFGVTLPPLYWLKPHLMMALASSRGESWYCSCSVSTCLLPVFNILCKLPQQVHSRLPCILCKGAQRPLVFVGWLVQFWWDMCHSPRASSHVWTPQNSGKEISPPLYGWEKWSQGLFMICPKVRSQ